MATIHREGNVDLLTGKVAVIGYGSQGHAHALNLRDSGIEVEVGLRAGSPSGDAAAEAGLTVSTVGEATQGAQVVAILVPDHVQKGVYEAEVEANLAPGAAERARLRQGHRRDQGRRHPDDLPRRDRDRPVRRAGRTLRWCSGVG